MSSGGSMDAPMQKPFQDERCFARFPLIQTFFWLPFICIWVGSSCSFFEWALCFRVGSVRVYTWVLCSGICFFVQECFKPKFFARLVYNRIQTPCGFLFQLHEESNVCKNLCVCFWRAWTSFSFLLLFCADKQD